MKIINYDHVLTLIDTTSVHCFDRSTLISSQNYSSAINFSLQFFSLALLFLEAQIKHRHSIDEEVCSSPVSEKKGDQSRVLDHAH
jgi:hypothetical protein